MNLPSTRTELPTLPTINQEFAGRALAVLFHSSPEQFLKLLEKDGNLFLRFYWVEAAKRFGIKAPNPPFGLNYVIKDPTSIMKIVLISLPAPEEPGDPYFAALVYRPLRVMIFSFIQDKTAVFLLEKTQKEEPDLPKISRISRRFVREETGVESAPKKDEFCDRVIEILADEN